MNSRLQRFSAYIVVLSSAALAVVGGLRLIAHGSPAVAGLPEPGLLRGLLPGIVTESLGLAIGLAGIAVGLLWRAAPPTTRPPILLQVATLAVAVITIVLTPGDLIPIAGYSFAALVIVGLVVLVALLVLRHPWWGLGMIAAIAAIATWLIVGLHAAEVAGMFGAAFIGRLPGVLFAAAHLFVAVGMLVLAAASRNPREASFAGWVMRHRVAITVAAACCALPYSIARASWLTPWPLLAPQGIDFAQSPEVLFTGLSLGAAMLSGGLLTLGLILPWGRRFPRWMAGLGGRPVPTALAVVPASVVAALFTVGGLDMMLSVFDGTLGDGSIGQTLEFALVFPFWLWGPLLALATWGYAVHRRAAGVPLERPVSTMA